MVYKIKVPLGSTVSFYLSLYFNRRGEGPGHEVEQPRSYHSKMADTSRNAKEREVSGTVFDFTSARSFYKIIQVFDTVYP